MVGPGTEGPGGPVGNDRELLAFSEALSCSLGMEGRSTELNETLLLEPDDKHQDRAEGDRARTGSRRDSMG